MSKPDGGAPAPDAAPAPAPKGKLSPSSIAKLQSVASERAEDIVEWNDRGGDESFSSDGAANAAQAASRPRIVDDKPGHANPGDPDFVEEQSAAAPKVEPKKDDEPPKETAADKRARALKALSAESRLRTVEGELKTTQERAGAFEKMTLNEILKARGETEESMLEKLLTGTAGLELPKKLEGTEGEVAALKSKLDALEAKDKARDKAESDRQVQEAVRTVGESLKEMDDLLPLVNSMTGAHERVLTEAWKDWTAAGSTGAMADFLPLAAERVETTLAKENPRLAARIKAAAPAPKTTAERAAAALTDAAPRGITRRTAARPNAEPTKLPDDRDDRDQAIKREMGW